jgi:hypothetical protein
VDTYVSISSKEWCDEHGTLEEKMRLSDGVLGDLMKGGGDMGGHGMAVVVFVEDMWERPEHLSQVLIFSPLLN